MLKNVQNENNNLKIALDLFKRDLPQRELINYLQTGSIVERQVCALKLEKFENIAQAEILLSNLTGHDGKIREAVSSKIEELITKYPDFFTPYYKILLASTIDINPNVCRNIISAVSKLADDKTFAQNYTNALFDMVEELLNENAEGKYGINKRNFKLYWCLEALSYFELEEERLRPILLKTKEIDEYTIREKTAKLSLQKGLEDILNELKTDGNYYVLLNVGK